MPFRLPEINWPHYWPDSNSFTEVSNWVKEWSREIIWLSLAVIVILIYSISSTTSSSMFSLCSDKVVKIITVNKTLCNVSKRISNIQVLGDLILKTCHLESTVRIKLGESNLHGSSGDWPTAQSSISDCDRCAGKSEDNFQLPKSSQAMSSSSTENLYESQSQRKYEKESMIMNLMHRNCLKRILTTEKWSTICNSEDIPKEFSKYDILKETSFVSIKLIAFSVNTESEKKAAYIAMRKNFVAHVFKSISGANISKSWTFNPSRCLVSQYAEVVAIPMEMDQQVKQEWQLPDLKIFNIFQSTLNPENRCSHLTKEIIAPRNMTVPSVILSVMSCH